jgi:hypothetical protein
MYVLRTRNVHNVLPLAINRLLDSGMCYERESRNGPVMLARAPVATVYSSPQERVIFWPQRDANPFLHLYESLWMLAGRNDVAPLARFTKQFDAYSDDGVTLHGAYGHRWKQGDQLDIIADRLSRLPNDRRCVLQMWNSATDLGKDLKDVPCNLMVTFQLDMQLRLDMVVFNRSNDVIWGAYGANAVHFSMLQEYMSAWIGVPMGTMTQISVNWHAYLNVLEPLKAIGDESVYGSNYTTISAAAQMQPYRHRVVPMVQHGDMQFVNEAIRNVLAQVDSGFTNPRAYYVEPFFEVVAQVLLAHHLYKEAGPKDKFRLALGEISHLDPDIDWVCAAKEWFERRSVRQQEKA